MICITKGWERERGVWEREREQSNTMPSIWPVALPVWYFVDRKCYCWRSVSNQTYEMFWVWFWVLFWMWRCCKCLVFPVFSLMWEYVNPSCSVAPHDDVWRTESAQGKQQRKWRKVVFLAGLPSLSHCGFRLIDWVRENKAKKCPACSYFIEKDGGCNHMECGKYAAVFSGRTIAL